MLYLTDSVFAQLSVLTWAGMRNGKYAWLEVSTDDVSHSLLGKFVFGNHSDCRRCVTMSPSHTHCPILSSCTHWLSSHKWPIYVLEFIRILLMFAFGAMRLFHVVRTQTPFHCCRTSNMFATLDKKHRIALDLYSMRRSSEYVRWKNSWTKVWINKLEVVLSSQNGKQKSKGKRWKHKEENK